MEIRGSRGVGPQRYTWVEDHTYKGLQDGCKGLMKKV